MARRVPERILRAAEDLERLLFKTPLKDGDPLFPNAASLIQEMCDVNKALAGKRESIQTQLSRALNGTRGIPERLKEGIQTVVRMRAKELYPVDATNEWVKSVRTAIETLNRRRGTSEAADEDDLFEAMMEALRGAKRIYILGSYFPLQLMENVESAKIDEFRQTLFRRLCGLQGGGTSDDQEVDPDRETETEELLASVYLSIKGAGDTFWMRLNDWMDSDEVVGEGWRNRKQEVLKNVTVYEVPGHAADCTLVVLDPDSDLRRRGFNAYYHPEDRISISEMDPFSLRHWRDTKYEALKRQKIPIEEIDNLCD